MKTNLYLKLFNVFFGLLIIISGCQKDRSAQENKQTLQIDQKLEKHILAFTGHFEQYKKGNILKDDAEISIDSAISYIDAVFNYMYCFQLTEYLTQVWDTSYIEIPLTHDGTVLVNVDLYIAYDTIIGAVRNKYRNVNEKNKKLVGLVFQKLHVDPITRDQVVRLISQITYGGKSPDCSNDHFYARDSWTCDQVCAGPGQGAANLLERDENFASNPAPPPGYRISLSNSYIETWDIQHDLQAYLYPGDLNPQDNFEDYYFYHAESDFPNWSYPLIGCVEGYTESGTEMTFYGDQLSFYVDQYEQNHLPFKCSNCYINSLDLSVGNPPVRVLYHKPEVTFSIKHLCQVSLIYPMAID